MTCSTLGEAVLSTFVTGEEDPASTSRDPGTRPRPSARTPGRGGPGTSFAAPQVAAAVASRARRTGSSLDEALAHVLAGAVGHAPGYGALLPSTN